MYHRIFPFLNALLFPFLLFWACESKPPCREPLGSWTNKEGQTFIFQPEGKTLWLIRFGSQVDTVFCQYKMDCSTNPVSFDFSAFQSGPYAGRTLYGIMEWSSDSAFRLVYDGAIAPEDRPKAFVSGETDQFFPAR